MKQTIPASIAEARSPHPTFVLRATDDSGNVMYYTGRSGRHWVDPDVEKAFPYQTLTGARRKATQHNALRAIHGLYFMVVGVMDDSEIEEAT